MDFFQAQDNAVRKTKRLVFYYLLAVILIVIAVYLAVTAGFVFYDSYTRTNPGDDFTLHLKVPIWDPVRFTASTIGVILLVGLGTIYKVLALRGGGAAVANSLGGERVDRSTRDPDRRRLLNVVEEIAIASGVPVPEVYILSGESSINAFAAGWTGNDAVVAVSQGSLETLSRDELQGVVAHEYSHILNGDCRLNIRLMGLLFGIMMLSIFGRMMGAVLRGGGTRRGRGPIIVARGRSGGSGGGGKGNGKGGAIVLAVILVIVLVTIIGYIGTFFGRLIQAAISRQREFLADASAVQFTRNPNGIAGALKRIAVHSEHSVLNHPGAGEAAHMFFADGMKRSFSSVLATHPPLRERIKEIQPNWDGEYKVEKRTRNVEPAESPKAKAATGPIGGGGFIEGMAVLGAIGTITADNLAGARKIKDAIPKFLDDTLRYPEGARYCIMGLLIVDNEEDDSDQMKLVRAALPDNEITEFLRILPVIRGLSREERLGVLELSASTLSQASDHSLDSLYLLMDDLIKVDEHMSVYEFCVRRILRERLKYKPTGDQEKALVVDQAGAASHLLSLVARRSSGPGDPANLVNLAVSELPLLRECVEFLDVTSTDIKILDEALDFLKTTTYTFRSECLRAVVTCFEKDGKLTAEEAEILRMIGLSLDCPVPPLNTPRSRPDPAKPQDQ